MLQSDFCAICGSASSGQLTAITVQGHRFAFCDGHAAELRPTVPTTVAELQSRFGSVGLERRGLVPRRLNHHRKPGADAEQPRHAGRRASD